MNPFFLFHNVFDVTGVTLAASSEAGGYPKENATDWRWAAAYSWKASASGTQWLRAYHASTQPADTCILAGHNLYTAGALITIQWSHDAVTWTDVDSEIGSNWRDEIPITLTWDSVDAEYWRIYLTGCSVAPYISIATLGSRLELPYGLPDALDPKGEEAVTNWTQNRAGQPLGSDLRYIRKSFTLAVDPGMTLTEFYQKSGVNFDDDWIPHSRSKPFWFACNPPEDWRDTWLCWRDGAFASPIQNLRTRRTLNIPMIAYIPAGAY